MQWAQRVPSMSPRQHNLGRPEHVIEHARACACAAVVRHSTATHSASTAQGPGGRRGPRLLCLRLRRLRLRRLRPRSRPLNLAAAHAPMICREGRSQAAPHAHAPTRQLRAPGRAQYTSRGGRGGRGGRGRRR